MKRQSNMLNRLLVISVGILISCLAYFYVFEAYAFNSSFYIKHFTALKVNEIVGISTSDLEKVTTELVDYINTGQGDLHVKATLQNHEIEYFNAKEQAHLNDIKILVKSARKFRNFILMLTLTLMIITLLRSKFSSLKFSNILLSTVLSSFTTLIILGLLYLSDFDLAFRKFHELLFYNDLWLLDPFKDRLLQMMPLEFFMIFTLYCLGTIFALNVVLLLIFLFTNKVNSRSKRMFR